jgi:hypothetical protein
MSATTELDHEKTFAEAWANPRYTRTERPPVDVNAVLAKHYRLSSPHAFTRTEVWDMEVRKAFRPDIYIPMAVQEGTAGTWNVRDLGDGQQSFYRRTNQRQRLVPGYDLVLEQVRVNPSNGKVTFIGSSELPGEDVVMLHAGTQQPLFHVEHVASGTETVPINEWRIVHCTDGHDQRLIDQFIKSESVYLPQFLEVYMRVMLNLEFERLPPV